MKVRKKGGRPLIEDIEKRSYRVNLMLNTEEYLTLASKAGEACLSFKDFIQSIIPKAEWDDKGAFIMTESSSNGDPMYTNHFPIKFDVDFEQQWIMHPDPNIDLCVMPFNMLVEVARRAFNKTLFFRTFDNTLIPDIKQISEIEAQRAWTKDMTANFMHRKKNRPGFPYSEPEFLISCMDCHKDWVLIVCLVGGGQEINTGEAGISEWIASLYNHFKDWHVHISSFD